MAERVRVAGLISDTHGLLREAALKALAGSDLTILAGDIGKLEILDALQALAPVVAVRGNILDPQRCFPGIGCHSRCAASMLDMAEPVGYSAG